MHPKVTKIVASVLAGIILLGSGFYLGLGYQKPERNVVITDSKQIIDGDFSHFWEAVDLAKQKYVNIKDVKDADILSGAIKGAIAALGDPYTTYFDPEEAKKFEQDLSGSFGGIGAEIGIRNNQLTIIAPLKGNPAEEAGLRAGDEIIKIDGTVTTGMSVDDGVNRIRGKQGTDVVISIFRQGWSELKDFKVTRRTVVLPTVDWELKDGNIAYIQAYNFNANVVSLFSNAVVSALASGAKGVVLDLRNNPGGFLDAAVEMAGWFLEPGSPVVEERFKAPEKPEMLKTHGNAALAKMPIAVLVNGGSASASEILAGALRDNRGIKLIGEKTFGKGSVQEIETMDDGSTIKVSIAEWFTPKGTRIQKLGLTPDNVVSITDKDIKAKKDPQLEKALAIVKSEIGK